MHTAFAATPSRLCAAALVLLVAATGARAQDTNTVRITGGVLNQAQTNVGTQALVGMPFVVDLLGMPVGEAYFGQADGASNTLRGQLAQKGNDNSNEPQGRSSSRFVKTVGAGSSGLANGTPVQVNFSWTLDGLLAAGALDALTGSLGMPLAPGGRYTALSSAHISVLVIDLNNPTSSLQNPDLDFRYVAALEVAMGGAASYVFEREAASAFSPSGPWNWAGNTETTTPFTTPEYQFQSRSIAPRSFSFNVDTAVGHALSIRLDLVVDSSGTSAGTTIYVGAADFGRTFDAEIVPLAAGLVITPDLAGVAALPVPEPGQAALWLLGLCGLAGWHARRRIG